LSEGQYLTQLAKSTDSGSTLSMNHCGASRIEKLVQNQLESEGYESFLPLFRVSEMRLIAQSIALCRS